MLELYFVFYRIPKIMSELARERQRSALAWSLLGIFAWLGAELFIAFGVGLSYGIAAFALGWQEDPSTGLTILTYVLALGAAIGSFFLVKKILTSRPKPGFAQPPPPPPSF
jgi:hypothetical protein